MFRFLRWIEYDKSSDIEKELLYYIITYPIFNKLIDMIDNRQNKNDCLDCKNTRRGIINHFILSNLNHFLDEHIKELKEYATNYKLGQWDDYKKTIYRGENSYNNNIHLHHEDRDRDRERDRNSYVYRERERERDSQRINGRDGRELMMIRDGRGIISRGGTGRGSREYQRYRDRERQVKRFVLDVNSYQITCPFTFHPKILFVYFIFHIFHISFIFSYLFYRYSNRSRDRDRERERDREDRDRDRYITTNINNNNYNNHIRQRSRSRDRYRGPEIDRDRGIRRRDIIYARDRERHRHIERDNSNPSDNPE